MSEPMCYIGVKACGCRVAAAVDKKDKETRQAVASWMRSGLTIERVTVEEVRRTLRPCKCGVVVEQASLPLEPTP